MSTMAVTLTLVTTRGRIISDLPVAAYPELYPSSRETPKIINRKLIDEHSYINTAYRLTL